MRSLCKRHPEWLVILAGISAALHVGKLSPALPLLQGELGITLVQSGFLLSLVQLAGMVLGLAVGLAADSLGYRRCMLAGLLLLFASGLAAFGVQGVAALLAWRAAEGVGLLLVSMPAPALIRRLVPAHQLRPAMGLWGAYMPLGTALALLAGPWVLQAWGWRPLWWLASVLSLVLAVCIWLGVPSDAPLAGGSAQSPRLVARPGAPWGWTQRLRRTLEQRGPWLVAFTFAMYSGQWLAVIGFLPSIVADSGYAGQGIALALALAAGVNVIGNVVAGRLLARGVAAQHLLVLGFVAMGVGAACAFYEVGGTSPPVFGAAWRYAGVLLFSMLGGLIPATLFTLALTVSPDESCASSTVGWMQQWSALGQFAGPPLVASVAAQAGSWRWTWCVTGAACLLGLLLARLLAREVRR